MASKQSKPVLRAVLKYPDYGKVETLLIHNEKGFRWTPVPNLEIGSTDHVTKEIAVKYLRVAVDSDPSMVGCDLTIYPISPPAVERAAARILDGNCISRDWDSKWHETHSMVQEIIEQETDITELMEHLQVLLAYLFRCQVPFVDPATRRVGMVSLIRGDLTLRGLILPVVESIEKAMQEDLSNLKKILTAPVERIVVAQPAPPERKN